MLMYTRFARENRLQVIGRSAHQKTLGKVKSALTVLALLPSMALGAEGDQMRITVANELRTYARQLPAAACHLQEEIETEASAQKLASTVAEYDLFLSTLRNGNADFGIPEPEERRKTLAAIDAVEAAWLPTRANATAIIDNGPDEELVANLVSQSDDLLFAAELLAVEVARQYTNSAQLVQADAFLLELAGRQRTFIQEMEIKSCMIRLGLAQDMSKDILSSTVQSFGATLDALRNGLATAGVRPPPTPTIAAGLDRIHDDWQILEPKLQQVLAGEELDLAAESAKIGLMEAMMREMTEVQQLYFEALQP